jgi:actin related protein 2/3 complex subunit 2
MILLEYHNKIIEDTLLDRYRVAEEGGTLDSIEMVLSDFDGVSFHVSSDPNAANVVYISISIKCYHQLQQYGVDQLLQEKYAGLLTDTEANYDATLMVDLSQSPGDEAATKQFVRNVALLKRHCFAAPFTKVFSDIDNKQGGGIIQIDYRDDECMYIKPESDRAIVIFQVSFKDKNDIVYSRVFLQAYEDLRKTMKNVPAVSYSPPASEPPLELQGQNVYASENQGFVSFVLFQPQMAPAKRDKTIDNIETFRNFLLYHLKCSKAYMHARMRNRVRDFLQVLNRAKSDPITTEKKTITGKTFRRG